MGIAVAADQAEVALPEPHVVVVFVGRDRWGRDRLGRGRGGGLAFVQEEVLASVPAAAVPARLDEVVRFCDVTVYCSGRPRRRRRAWRAARLTGRGCSRGPERSVCARKRLCRRDRGRGWRGSWNGGLDALQAGRRSLERREP